MNQWKQNNLQSVSFMIYDKKCDLNNNIFKPKLLLKKCLKSLIALVLEQSKKLWSLKKNVV